MKGFDRLAVGLYTICNHTHHTCMHMHIHGHICVHIYVYIMYNHRHMYTYICVHHIQLYKPYMYAYVYTQIYAHTCPHTYVYAIYTTCMCIHVHVCTLHMHTPACVCIRHIQPCYPIEFRNCKEFRDYPIIWTPQFLLSREPTIISSMVVIFSGQEPLAPSSVTPKIYFKWNHLLWTPRTSYMLHSDGCLPEPWTQGCLKYGFS